MSIRSTIALLLACGNLACANAFGWGDEGHEIVALVADTYLDSQVRDQVNAMLKGDKTGLTAKDLAHEATWADRYRDSDRNSTKKRYNQTHNWHFVDIELEDRDMDAACFGHPVLAPGTPASQGPAKDCVVDKINEFAEELASTDTPPAERRTALQFLLHFVGDLHQPLHASDDHDQGGNSKKVSAKGIKAGKLHGYWDTAFVERLGRDPTEVAQTLLDGITEDQVQQWSQGTPEDWAAESFSLAHEHAYGMLPEPDANGTYRLTAKYVNDAANVVALQLSRAGVRLAKVLNEALR
jgi:hypothetical protein